MSKKKQKNKKSPLLGMLGFGLFLAALSLKSEITSNAKSIDENESEAEPENQNINVKKSFEENLNNLMDEVDEKMLNDLNKSILGEEPITHDKNPVTAKNLMDRLNTLQSSIENDIKASKKTETKSKYSDAESLEKVLFNQQSLIEYLDLHDVNHVFFLIKTEDIFNYFALKNIIGFENLTRIKAYMSKYFNYGEYYQISQKHKNLVCHPSQPFNDIAFNGDSVQPLWFFKKFSELLNELVVNDIISPSQNQIIKRLISSEIAKINRQNSNEKS